MIERSVVRFSLMVGNVGKILERERERERDRGRRKREIVPFSVGAPHLTYYRKPRQDVLREREREREKERESWGRGKKTDREEREEKEKRERYEKQEREPDRLTTEGQTSSNQSSSYFPFPLEFRHLT